MLHRSQFAGVVFLFLGVSVPIACSAPPPAHPTTEQAGRTGAQPPDPAQQQRTAAATAVDASIAAGLCWIARHQDDDGAWSPRTAANHCDSAATIYRPKKAYTEHFDGGVTALAVLALLGAVGSNDQVEDPATGAVHDIRAVARKGVAKLVAVQRENGSFSPNRSFLYVEALATQALCEAVRVLGDRDLVAPAQSALDFVQAAQRPSPLGSGLWGWRYASRQEIEQFQRANPVQSDVQRAELHDSDTSVTGRCVAALRAGIAAGLAVDAEHVQGAQDFVRWASQRGADGEPTGLVGYLDARGAGAKVTGPYDHYVYHPAVMSAIAMQVLRPDGGEGPFDARAAELICRDLPTISADKLSIDYYYWHNGTHALDAGSGTADQRAAWNSAVTSALIALQDRTAESCTYGGWLVEDRWTLGHGGPVYTTALNVLTLQACR